MTVNPFAATLLRTAIMPPKRQTSLRTISIVPLANARPSHRQSSAGSQLIDALSTSLRPGAFRSGG